MKSPAFQFYVQDFMVGTLHFSAEEVGAYIRLLCHQWDTGFIEEDEKKLKKITGISAKKCEKILKKFSKGEDGFLKNLRLEEERVKQLELRKRRSDAGKRGNDVKYNHSQSDPIAVAKQAEKSRKGIALQSSSSTSSSTSVKIQNTEQPVARVENSRIPPSYQLVWEIFFRQGGTEEMAKTFYEKKEAVGWMDRGSPIKNFAALVPSFIRSWKEIRNETNSVEKKEMVF